MGSCSTKQAGWVGSSEFVFPGLRTSYLDLLRGSAFMLCFTACGCPDLNLVRSNICLQASLYRCDRKKRGEALETCKEKAMVEG